MESETGETISHAWARCGGQFAVDVRAMALVTLGLQQDLGLELTAVRVLVASWGSCG
jgi:hypothetical protein